MTDRGFRAPIRSGVLVDGKDLFPSDRSVLLPRGWEWLLPAVIVLLLASFIYRGFSSGGPPELAGPVVVVRIYRNHTAHARRGMRRAVVRFDDGRVGDFPLDFSIPVYVGLRCLLELSGPAGSERTFIEGVRPVAPR
jgi:hypothetical protein